MGNIILPMWAECPAITRTILLGYTTSSLSLSLVNAVTPLPLRAIFLCSLKTTVGDMCVWTLFLSPCFSQFAGGMSFLMTLFELYMGMMYFPGKERELGSLSFLAWFLLATFVQNSIFLSLMGILSTMDPPTYHAGTQGLWPLLMVAMSIRTLSDVGGATNFWGIAQIPNKWYPAFFVGIFCLLNQHMMWHLLTGITVGYIGYVYPSLHMERFLPSVAQITNLEQRLCRERHSCFGGSWLPASARGYMPTSLGSTSNSAPAPSSFGAPAWMTTSNNKFTVFSGSGHRLGEADDNACELRLEEGKESKQKDSDNASANATCDDVSSIA